jgi:hypothetical protein
MEILVLLLVVAAVIMFGLATFGVGARFNLIAAGLCALAIVQLVGIL